MSEAKGDTRLVLGMLHEAIVSKMDTPVQGLENASPHESNIYMQARREAFTDVLRMINRVLGRKA